jgi:hypothetical protein
MNSCLYRSIPLEVGFFSRVCEASSLLGPSNVPADLGQGQFSKPGKL